MSDIILGFIFTLLSEIVGAFTGIMFYKYYSERNKKTNYKTNKNK